MTHDQKNALEWIKLIESKNNVRDFDIYPRLKTWIQDASAIEILDIGCGQGICSTKIDLDGRNYTGIDPSAILIARAKELYSHPHRNFVQGDAYRIPYADQTFDAAYSITVWHLLEDIEKAARELHRILKPKAHFLVISANPDAYSLWTDQFVETNLVGKRFSGKMQIDGKIISEDVLFLHKRDEIMEAFQNANLRVQKTDTFRTNDKAKGQKYFISVQGQKI